MPALFNNTSYGLIAQFGLQGGYGGGLVHVQLVQGDTAIGALGDAG